MAQVVSERRKAKLVFQHNIYWKDGISNDGETVYWRCSNPHKSSCKARVHTVNGVLTKQLNEHNHINDQRDVKLAELSRNALPITWPRQQISYLMQQWDKRRPEN